MVSTRPDIAHSVGIISKFMQNWGEQHIQAAKNLLLYIRSTLHRGITYHRGSTTLVGFSDADWAGNPDNSRSTTGFIFYLANGPISWRSKEQQTVALSTAESEYMSLSAASQEAIHLRELLPILNVDLSSPTVIYEDNEAARQLASNPVYKPAVRHIAIRYHFVRDCVSNNSISVVRVDTSENLADLLTKSVDISTFEYLIDRYMGLIPYHPY